MVDDTVHIRLKVQATSLFSWILLSLNGEEGDTINKFYTKWLDTMSIDTVFSSPGAMWLKVTAELKNKNRLADSVEIVINGRPSTIVSGPGGPMYVGIGAACSVAVVASGTGDIHYQWTKDNKALGGDTTPRLFIDNFQKSDTGVYACIVRNSWGKDTSAGFSIKAKKETDKTVFWHFEAYRDTVDESDSAVVRVDSLYTAPAGNAAVLELTFTGNQASFRGDSVFVFKAGGRDSGFYEIPAVVASGSVSDTALIMMIVRPRYCALSLEKDSGVTIVNPVASTYRWMDTVKLLARPAAGFLFVGWQGDASGNDTAIQVVISKDMSIKAHFIAQSSSQCMEIGAGGSLNKAIRDASAGRARPKKICPEPGIYDQGTIKISGKVRIVLE